MNFSVQPNMVRVDFFKDSGKWYDTCEMEWIGYEGPIQQAFITSLRKAFIHKGAPCYQGMTAVCLQPYHEHGYPLMLRDWDSATS